MTVVHFAEQISFFATATTTLIDAKLLGSAKCGFYKMCNLNSTYQIHAWWVTVVISVIFVVFVYYNIHHKSDAYVRKLKLSSITDYLGKVD